MSRATYVPETYDIDAGDLSAEDAATTIRRTGQWQLAKDAGRRFVRGDGTSFARAVGLTLMLSYLPLMIAAVGLSSALGGSLGDAVQQTLSSVAPKGGADALSQAVEAGGRSGGPAGLVAVIAGLLTAIWSQVAAMAQLERAANRIYGLDEDRPVRQKYRRAAQIALLGGVPAVAGFGLVVGGGAAAGAFGSAFGWPGGVVTALTWLRWPVGVALDVLAVVVMFRMAPNRRQPAPAWLSVGAALAVTAWLAFTGLLVLYVNGSASFGKVYGPLTGIIALILWAQLTSVALLLGMAFAAQLESVRAAHKRAEGKAGAGTGG
jgi:YihY family inner membrane protein